MISVNGGPAPAGEDPLGFALHPERCVGHAERSQDPVAHLDQFVRVTARQHRQVDRCRVVARPGELQVGIVLALIGGPFFIALVRRRRLAGP